MIDQKIGEILEALDEQGYLDNAMIIFTSDHGDCLGDHGLSQKWSGYDEVVHVPVIVWRPGTVKAGHEVSSLCQQFDISQTLLEMAGIQIPSSFESKSVMDGLLGKLQSGRKYVFAEQGGDGNLTDAQMVTMVRSKKWKMIHYVGEKFGQLFDLEKDPLESINLWEDTSYDDEKRSLHAALLDWHIQSQYRTRDWASDFR
jgi:arylsulfatase A-like enzyme